MATLFRVIDSPLRFFEFAMDRSMPTWVYPHPGQIVLHLGPGVKHIDNTTELEWPEWDADKDRIPHRDGEVGGIIATHFFEHLANPRWCLEECLRVLRPGAALTLMVPHAQSPMYLQDMDHKQPYILDSWKSWQDSTMYTKGKPKARCRVGFNAKIAIKEGNEAIITQLIKEAD